MFKRLLNRKDEKASSQASSQIDETQGFVCPICMISLQSAEGLQQHFEDAHDENKQRQGEGFLCPICKLSLSSPEELQAHFDSKHDEKSVSVTTENRDGDVLAMRQEIDDLKTSLKEERWYTDELKKELEKLPSEGATKAIPLSVQERSELEMIRLQLRGSEESRTLLSSEVHHLQTKISEMSSKLENETMEKEKLQNNFEKLNSEWIAMKARSNELEGQRGAHEDHILTLKQQVEQKEDIIKSLEIQLNQRPGTEDVLVLKQELISVQKLMDNMTLEKENEMKELVRKMTDLEERYKRLKSTDFEKSKHIEKLLIEIKEKDAEMGCIKQENIKVQSIIETKNSQITDLELQLSTVTHHYQTECTTSDELKTNLREKIQLLEEEARRASVRDKRLTEMESRQQSLVAEIDRLGMERAELIAKVTSIDLTENVQKLSSLLTFPWMMNPQFKELYKSIEDLISYLKKYDEYLCDCNKKMKANHESTVPSRDLKDNWILRDIESVENVSEDYKALDLCIKHLPEYQPIDLIRFEPDDKEERRKWIKQLSLSNSVALYSFQYGNNLGNMNVLWKIPGPTCRDMVKQVQVKDKIKRNILKFSTRKMQRDFIDCYKSCTRLQPVILRNMYSYLTEFEYQANSANAAQIDEAS